MLYVPHFVGSLQNTFPGQIRSSQTADHSWGWEILYNERIIEVVFVLEGVQGGLLGLQDLPFFESRRPIFYLTTNLHTEITLKVIPGNILERFLRGTPFLDGTKKIQIDAPFFKKQLTVLSNNEFFADLFFHLNDVKDLLLIYGMDFFDLEKGILKIHLDQLPSDKFKDLMLNPSKITEYFSVMENLISLVDKAM